MQGPQTPLGTPVSWLYHPLLPPWGWVWPPPGFRGPSAAPTSAQPKGLPHTALESLLAMGLHISWHPQGSSPQGHKPKPQKYYSGFGRSPDYQLQAKWKIK